MTTNSRPAQITESHLRRKAVVYIRQSTEEQVKYATGSAALQRDLVAVLQEWGWPPASIEVIDDDLGVSGSHAGLRRGFNDLLQSMDEGRVGVVAVTDISRLARNIPDLFAFAVAVRRHDILLAHGKQIVDFSDPNSEFTSLILGLNAARENRARAEHSRRSRRKKAESGVASTAPPAGYIHERGGTWRKDLDDGVPEIIQLVFDKFDELGSCGAVYRYFTQHRIQMPRRREHGNVAWGAPSRVRIHRILRNPAYAGIYVYGATKSEDGRQIAVAAGERLHIEAHHAPYVPQLRWAGIQQRLSANRRSLRAPLGRGDALVQGLLRCTLHDQRLSTAYPARDRRDGTVIRRAVYRCYKQEAGADQKFCCVVRGSSLDRLIEKELLRVLTPPAADVLEEVHREGQGEYDTQLRLRQSRERQAEQAAAEAERAYQQASTSHTMVRERLSEQWEEALRHVQEIRTEHRIHPLLPPSSISEADQRELRQLLTDLPSLWQHPDVTPALKKTIARAAISEVHVTPGLKTWTIDIEWVGGHRTSVDLLTSKGVRAIVEQAVSDGRTPSEIARILSDRGAFQRSGPHLGKPYTAQTVKLLIRRFGWDRSIKREAYAHLRARYIENVPLRQIADELNARRLSHSQGAWTEHRVQGAIYRLRLHDVAGVPALPQLELVRERVVALHRSGRSAVEIAAELGTEGALSRQRRAFTPDTVRQIIRRSGRAASAESRGSRRARRKRTLK